MGDAATAERDTTTAEHKTNAAVLTDLRPALQSTADKVIAMDSLNTSLSSLQDEMEGILDLNETLSREHSNLTSSNSSLKDVLLSLSKAVSVIHNRYKKASRS